MLLCEAYWVDRHQKLKVPLLVGKASHHDEDQDYGRKSQGFRLA